MPHAVNDDRHPPRTPDAHGEAALILVESLMHGLMARSSLSVGETIEIVRSAIEVLDEIHDERGDDPTIVPTSSHLLSAIANSLRVDADPNDPANLDLGERGPRIGR